MGIVFVNKQNFWERTKFVVNDGVVQKENEQWTHDLDRLKQTI